MLTSRLCSFTFRTLTSALIVAVCSSLAIAEANKPSGAPVRNEDRQFSKRVRNWKELKRDRVVMQRRDYSCGAAALATITTHYWGDDRDEEYFLKVIATILTRDEMKDRVENGLALSDIRRAAVKAGYQAVVGKLTYEKLKDVKVPVVVGISPDGYDHFVVYRGMDGYWAYLADPIRGNIRIPLSEFLEQWQEKAVLAVHKKGEKVKDVSPLAVRDSEK